MTQRDWKEGISKISSTAVGHPFPILLISRHIEPALSTKEYQVSPEEAWVLVGTSLDNRGGSDLSLPFLIYSSILGQLRGG
jgi:hypothetical protein